VPPLRERRGDLAPLATALVAELAAKLGVEAPGITRGVLGRLEAHDWPGNVRELMNVLETALILGGGKSLELPEPFAQRSARTAVETHSKFETAVREAIEESLRVTRGKIYGADGAAARLGLKPERCRARCASSGFVARPLQRRDRERSIRATALLASGRRLGEDLNVPWFVYLARCADDTFYCGITNDLVARLTAHNAGKGARYTRTRRPIEILVTRRCTTKGRALRLEYRVKQLTRAQKLTLIAKPAGFAALSRMSPRRSASRTPKSGRGSNPRRPRTVLGIALAT